MVLKEYLVMNEKFINRHVVSVTFANEYIEQKSVKIYVNDDVLINTNSTKTENNFISYNRRFLKENY